MQRSAIKLACPNRETWSAFHAGHATPFDESALVDHLDDCLACQRVLASLDGGSDDLVAALRNDAPTASIDPYEAEPECARALDRLMTGPPATSIPDRIGEYRVVRAIGRGGMGMVYEAVHTRLNRTVALKVLPGERAGDAAAVMRFHREMAALGQLDHPNVVRATDAGEADGLAYLVMDLIDGADLARLVTARGPIPVADACELARQAAVGLQHLAGHGLVHRDVKPSNLMLDRTGAVKILDLGLAFAPGGARMTTGQVLGTVDYVAPEQTDPTATVDPRADVYALGCTLFHLLTGSPPFAAAGPARAKLLAHAAAPVPSVRDRRPDVPAALDAIVTRMMAKNPADRFPTPGAVANALAPFAVGSDPVRLLDDSLATPILLAARKSRRVLPWIVAAVVLIGVGVLAATVPNNRTAREATTSPTTPTEMAPPPRLAQRSSTYPVAVFHFDEREGAPKGLGATVADLLCVHLSADPRLILLDREGLGRILAEQQLGLSGAVAPGSEPRVGQLTGARLLVTGSVVRDRGTLTLTAKVIGTETTAVRGVWAEGRADGELTRLVKELAGLITRTIADHGPGLAPPPAPRADRGAEIRAKLVARALPSVAVTLKEQPAGGTARAELVRLLRETGFEVTDDPARGDVLLIGDALAEAPARHGAMWSGVARIEVKALRHSTGAVIATDRQRAVAVDLSDALAARAALEEAVGPLAARLLPQLTK